eukprot:gene38990-13206_t
MGAHGRYSHVPSSMGGSFRRAPLGDSMRGESPRSAPRAASLAPHVVLRREESRESTIRALGVTNRSGLSAVSLGVTERTQADRARDGALLLLQTGLWRETRRLRDGPDPSAAE